MAQRSTNWVFTLNNYTPEDEQRLAYAQSSGHLRWILYGREVGDSGTQHLQGVCGSTSQRTLSSMRKHIHDRAHWEPMRGRVDQATDYCKKDGSIFQLGVVPSVSNEAVRGDSKAKYARLILLSEQRDIETIKLEYPVQYFIHYKRIIELGRYNTDKLPSEERVNIWYYGLTGTGKSFRARQNENLYLKKRNKWWDGYNNEENVLIEEWAPGNELTAQELKIWADVYEFPAEMKGSTIRIRPKKIIVTSNYTMRECFEKEEDYLPLKRRFREIRCDSWTHETEYE